MDTTKLLIVQIGFAVLSFACAGVVLWGLGRALRKAQVPEERVRRTQLMVGGGIALWMAITAALSISGVFADFSSFPPKVAIALMVPLVALTILTFSKRTATLLDAVPPQWLLLLQGFRIPVEILLWLGFAAAVVPVQMTFEGYNFDVLSGILGLVIGFTAFSGGKRRKSLAIAYNFLGLALLFTILTIAILSMPTPIRQFMNEPANTMVAVFPIVWLPAILVPLAYVLHLLSLRQLLRK